MAALGREHAGQRAAALWHAAPAGAARAVALMRQRAQELHRNSSGSDVWCCAPEWGDQLMYSMLTTAARHLAAYCFRTAHSLLPRLNTQAEDLLFFCKGTKAFRCQSRREILYPGAGAICVMLIEPAGWQLVPLPDYQQIQGHEKCCSHPKRYKAEE